MKTTAVFALILASAAAFNAPQFATRAVGKTAPAGKKAPVKKAPAKKAPAKVTLAKKAPAKKAPAKKAPAKKTPAMKAPANKAAAAFSNRGPPPESKGYPSIADKAQSFRLGKINGGGNKPIDPVFIHPTVNTAPPPSFDYKEASKARLTKNQEFTFDDGLTELERKQRVTLPAFLSGSAKSNVDTSSIRDDIAVEEFAFGLDSDRFQLLFISIFGLFTLVGCLSGAVSLD